MRKLEIGSQNKRLGHDWETLDILPGENVDIVANIEERLPIASNQYDLVYMSHVIEHVPWFKTDAVLKELHRIIAPGGKIEIYTPDLDKLIKAYQSGSMPDGWRRYNPQNRPILWFLGRMYAYGEDHADPNWHKNMFNERYLHDCLIAAGFKSTRRINAPRGHNHGYINLGMEATKCGITG